jgi:hypothetical protein
MHRPLQSTSPGWQETWQLPAEHTWPEVQMAPSFAPAQSPEAPQKARSVWGFTQAPPQLTRPAWQESAQVPALQTCPAVQLVPMAAPVQSPEAPQWERSESGSTQRPLQSTRPAWQETWQVPAEQTWPDAQAAPAFGAIQVPEAPQKNRSVCGLTQAPPQAIWPAGQLVVQAPAEQTWPDAQTVPAFGAVQLPEAPQKDRSVCGLTQEPAQAI